MARLYGTGSLWLRKSKKHPKGEWWIRFYDKSGVQRAENARACLCHQERSEAKAQKLLAKRIGENEAGTLPSPKARRTLVEDLAAALFKHQRAESLRKIPENLPATTRLWRLERAEKVLALTEGRWKKHLLPVFGSCKASSLTRADFDEYVVARLKARAKHATVNRELQLLRRMYRLGYETKPKMVQELPQFPERMAESARTGFIEDAAFKKLHAAFPEPGLRAMVLTAYRLGFRKSELQNILVRQFESGWLRLFAGATKNGKARAVALPNDVRIALEGSASGKKADDYLFTWPNGDRILDFRAAWKRSTKAAGVPGLLFHDLRRSAVRRMRQRGIPTAVAMKITGHLTRQIFEDYDSAHDSDVAKAALKI